MKTKSFLLGAASLMLAASCSNDEVVNVAPQSGAIGFSSFVNNSTRGESTYANIDDLKVWGVTSRAAGQDGTGAVAATEIFAGQLVEKNGANAGDGVWTYSPLRYWIAGNDYSFAAIAPASVVGVEGENKLVTVSQSLEGSWSEAGLTITFDNKAAEAEKDILYATKTAAGVAADNNAVALNLKHMLSRVRFQFENGLKNNETIEITGLQINNAVANAYITKAEGTGTWTPAVAENNTFVVPFTAEAEADKVVATAEKYLIPTTDELKYTINFTVNRKVGNNVIATYKHENVAIGQIGYKNNNSYTFKATLDAANIDPVNELEPIQFTATVTNWTENPAEEIEDLKKVDPNPAE